MEKSNMIRYLLLHKDHRFSVKGVNSGAEMATLHLARYLAKRGFEVVVAAQLVEGECEQDGIQFWDLGARFDLQGAIERMRVGGEYHLISAGRSQPFFLVDNDPLCVSKILISHDRSGNDTGIHPTVLCERLDRVICVSEAQRQVFLEAGAPPEKVVTIRNGVDLDLFSVGAIEKRDWKKIVFVGALVQDKGLHVLLSSYHKLQSKHPELSLDVYGSADLWGRSEMFDPQQIESQLSGVKFHGKVSQAVVSQAFQSAGICAVPSIWFDPFPLTSIEAQVTGCPVVTFNVGGLGEGVRDHQTGRVLQDITEEALTTALDDLLSAPEKLQQMSTQAIQLQRPYFNWERVIDEITELQTVIKQEVSVETQKPKEGMPRIGVMSTWNQTCGLATYANFLTAEWDESSYVILAEDKDENRTRADGNNVTRCWTWENSDWSPLVQASSENNIQTLIVNAHNPEQIANSNFDSAIRSLQANGVHVILLIHSIFTKREGAQKALQYADAIIVHTPEMKLEVASHGVPAEKIEVITHGVHALPTISNETKKEVRKDFHLPIDTPLASAIGFIQPHKGLEGLIEAIHGLRNKGQVVHACIAGSPNESDPNAVLYAKQIRELVNRLDLDEQVHFIERFLEDEEISALLQASDAVFMNYHSQHYEASGACSLALGARARVLTSIAPAFQAFGGAVWHMTAGFPPADALEEVLSNVEVQQALDLVRDRYVETHKWSKAAERFLAVCLKYNAKKANEQKEQDVTSNIEIPKKTGGTGKRILIQNRANMFSQRGGDTILVENLIAGLTSRGFQVELDLEGTTSPEGFDLVHLINFAVPDMIKTFGERAKNAGVPFVVTTLCEDVPTFHVQSRTLSETLVHYVRGGQSPQWLAENWSLYKSIGGCPPFENSWSASNAAALIVNGAGEEQVIQKSYQNPAPTHIVPVGHEIEGIGNPQLFINEHGVSDFIFCVGRLESRKNQLVLAHALEHVDIPLVFAAGGFSYQPDYADAVRRFKRTGPTIVLERLTPEMLASAYAAAKIHALPSWYELPGLVSLEAVMHGCNVVASDTGTTKDYLGEYGYYCQPDDVDSIRNATLAAYYTPFKEEAKQHVAQYTWAAATDATIGVYQSVLGMSSNLVMEESPVIPQSIVLPEKINLPQSTIEAKEAIVVKSNEVKDTTEFDAIAEQGFIAASEKRFEDAHRLLAEAEELNPQAVRVLSNRAAVFLAEQNVSQAKEYFQKALEVDSQDDKAQSGLGMCLMMEENKEQAYGCFTAVLERDPHQMVAILQLLDCAYALNRFEDLERALRRFLQAEPTNFDMRYCLAGCLLRIERFQECQQEIDRLFSEKPGHGGTQELQAALDDKKKEPLALDKTIEVEQELPKAPLQHETIPFDSIDVRLSELEELKQLRDLEDAIEGCDQLLTRQDLSELQKQTAELLRAEAMALTGDCEESESVFRSYIERDSKCARALCGLGAIVASKGDAIGARVHFENALKANPSFDKALAGLAYCEVSEGRNPQAWHLYEEALEVNPENLSALFGVVQLGYQLEKLTQVESHLDRYLEMHPADLDMVYAYAGCLFAQQRLDESLGEIEKILLFKADDERALELRGVIEDKLNAQAVTL